jgi:hypothetical protein
MYLTFGSPFSSASPQHCGMLQCRSVCVVKTDLDSAEAGPLHIRVWSRLEAPTELELPAVIVGVAPRQSVSFVDPVFMLRSVVRLLHGHHKNQSEDIVSDPGTEGQPLGEPKDPRSENPKTKSEEERPITEDPDGTPVENPSGG